MYSILYIRNVSGAYHKSNQLFPRANLAKTIESVCENHDPVIITKKDETRTGRILVKTDRS